LRELGYVEGRNIAIDYRWAEGRYDWLPDLAAELVRLEVDVIVTHTAQGVRAAQAATTTIPIVAATVADAVATGLIASLAHPGGNVTGLTFFDPELMAKRLELLQEVAPSNARAAILLNPDNAANGPVLKTMEITAKALKVGVDPFEVRGPGEFESTFAAIADKQIRAVVIQDDPVLITNAKAIADIALRRQLASCGFTEFVGAGGLMAYGVNFTEMFHRAAIFVDKLLKGAKPRDLPMEQPTRFELVVNLVTARALGIAVPAAILARADEVIE
jgi:putative ABC transport system substrate-binding protein